MLLRKPTSLKPHHKTTKSMPLHFFVSMKHTPIFHFWLHLCNKHWVPSNLQLVQFNLSFSLCEAVHFTSTRNQCNWCGDEWKSVTVPLTSCDSMTSKSFADHQQKNSQLMEEAKSDHIFIRAGQSNMHEWLDLATNYTRMVLRFWNLPRTVETNIRASKIAEPCHQLIQCDIEIFFLFFLVWIVVTGMGVSSPERQWLLQMTRHVICNPMWGSIYVNGSNLVRKEITTADDKMGDLQSDERFFLCKFPLPWVVTPALQTQYILVVLALDSIA